MNKLGRGNKIIEAGKDMADFWKRIHDLEILINILFVVVAIIVGIGLAK